MDLLHSGTVDGFCLVSSDSDFTRLAECIRETGSGARIATLVRVLREVGLEDWLATLASEPELGPIDRLEGRVVPAEPKRASRKRGGVTDG